MNRIIELLLNALLKRVDFESLFRMLLERLGLPEEFIQVVLDIIAELFKEQQENVTRSGGAVAGTYTPESVKSLLDRAK